MKTLFELPLQALLLAATLATLPAHSALIDIAESPLASTGSATVKPNVYFILDDSLSMNREYMPDSVGSNSSRYCYRHYMYNGVYYNPTITYATPVDAAGLAYANSTFTAAKTDGFNSGSSTTNLSTSFKATSGDSSQAAYYYKYTGTSPATPVRGTCYADTSYTKVVVSTTSGPGSTDERQNFANWYTYYRDRMNTMKSAAGLAFQSIDNKFRVGFSTISYTGSDSTNSDFLKIADFDSPQKTSWYSKLYTSTPSSYTPLRGALSKAGRLYAGKLLTGANDPVQYSCQQNFTILSTDGYWNDDTETSSYGPKKIDNTTDVGNQDGQEEPPYYDGTATTFTKSTSQIQQSQTQVTQNTSQLQKRTTQIQSSTSSLQKQVSQLRQDVGTLQSQTSTLQTRAGALQGALSKVLMRCNNTLASCGTAPASGVANANWFVVTSGTCTVSGSVQCSVISGLSGNVNVANTCNTAASITSTSGAGTATITVTNSSSARINQVRINGDELLAARTSSSSTNNTVASRIRDGINACTGSAVGNCDVSGNSATVNNNVVTITGPNVTAAPVVNVSSGSATITVSFTPGNVSHTLNNADSNGKVYSACSYNWGSWSNAVAACTTNKSASNPYTITSGTECQYTAWSAWSNSASACTASSQNYSNLTASQCQYVWANAQGTPACSAPAYAAGNYSNTSVYRNCSTAVTTPYANAASCTLSPTPDISGYTTQCQYTGWGAWANASSCTPLDQSTGPNYTTGTATQCQTTDTGWIGTSSCTPSAAGGQTVTCQGPVITGPTLVASCTPATANAGNNWITTTCTTDTLQAATPVSSCTPVAASAANSYVTTSCNTVTTGPTSVPVCSAQAASAANNWTTTTCSVGSTSGGTSNSLADVAEYYYKTDLRTSALGTCTGALGAGVNVCENNVPGAGEDVNSQQHMTTFTLGLGADGTLTYSSNYPSGGSADYNAIVNKDQNWPDPFANPSANGGNCNSTTGCPERIDDLWHAGVNGRGVYYSAQDPTSLINGLSSALAGVTARLGAAAAAATSTLQPVAGDNFLYVALYTTVDWYGDLQARTIDSTTGNVSSDAIWSAQALLDAKVSTASDTRTIYTFDSATSNKLKAFTWATLSGVEQSYFNNMCSPTVLLSQCTTLTAAQQTDASGVNLVNFLRGQYGNEGTLYRDRTHALGDIVNAKPVYVKAPPFPFVDPGYAEFKAAQTNRTSMVYEAANDGMLHAFNATAPVTSDSGTEMWAYIPPMVMSNLYRLADMSYEVNHRYYVDGSPVVTDICPNAPAASCSATQWKTILVGGLNAGGRGYYALDVTDPANPKALWNFTSSDDADLGYTFGNPVTVKRKDGTWVVVVTSGYNNVSPGDGKGHLYVLNAYTGELLEKIDNNTGSTGTPSGLGKLSAWVEVSTDNTAERFYAGDMLGNLWRFTLDGGTPPGTPVSTAGTAFLLTQVGQINGAGVQPITTKPVLTLVPYNGSEYVVIEFGTGRYLGVTDKSNTDQQTIYAIKDNLGNTGIGLARTAGLLVPQILSNFTGTNGEELRTTSTNPVDWAAKSGWYVDLNPGNTSPGERVTVDAELQLGVLTVAANVPTSGACDVGGYAYLYHFDFRSGTYMPTAAQDEAGTKLTGSMVAGISSFQDESGRVHTIVVRTTGDLETPETPPPPPPVGSLKRSSWRELID